MIEFTVRDFLKENVDVPVWMEVPKSTELPAQYVLVEKTGSSQRDHISTATFAVQSYAGSMEHAIELNSKVKRAVLQITALDEISSCRLNSDYNFTDTQTKRYRYQAVFDITYYEREE